MVDKSRIKGFFLYQFYRPAQKLLCLLPNLLCTFLPMKDEIIMESNPDLADNTFEVYRYIISKEAFNAYHIVWLVNDPEKYNDSDFPKRVSFFPIHPKSRRDKIKKYIMCNRAKIIIDCNRHYPKYKTSHTQLNVYLNHGMPLKNLTKYNHSLGLSCGYTVSQSDFFVPYIMQQQGVKNNQIIIAGVPRDDQLFIKHDSLITAYPDYKQYSKVISWVPTFRKMANGGRVDCVVKQPFGMPVLQSIEDIQAINQKLIETNTLLIIKPHPVQDLTFLNGIHSSNIKVLYNDEMLMKGIQTNELLEQTDAMITDYSGIYYDYLLLDRPIGITLDDFQDYSDQKGFVFEDPLNVLQGRKIYTAEDFIHFIEEVAKGIDEHKEDRAKANSIVNKGMNGESAKRIVDFIASQLNN